MKISFGKRCASSHHHKAYPFVFVAEKCRFFFLVLRIFLLTENIFTYVQTTIGPHGICKIINTWLDKLCDSISCWLWQKSRRRKAVSSKLVFGQQKAKKKNAHTNEKPECEMTKEKKTKKQSLSAKYVSLGVFPFSTKTTRQWQSICRQRKLQL